MLHSQRLFSTPDAEALGEVLATQQRLIEEILFRTIELTALVEAGQHRFLGRALDDLEQAEFALGEVEIARAAITEAIVGSAPGHEPALTEVLANLDREQADALSSAAERIRSTLTELASVRDTAASTTNERIARTRRAIRAATSETGLYERV